MPSHSSTLQKDDDGNRDILLTSVFSVYTRNPLNLNWVKSTPSVAGKAIYTFLKV